jgi:hypothetical protein
LNSNPVFAATALRLRQRCLALKGIRHLKEYPVDSTLLFDFSFSFPPQITSRYGQNLLMGSILAGGEFAPFADR